MYIYLLQMNISRIIWYKYYSYALINIYTHIYRMCILHWWWSFEWFAVASWLVFALVYRCCNAIHIHSHILRNLNCTSAETIDNLKNQCIIKRMYTWSNQIMVHLEYWKLSLHWLINSKRIDSNLSFWGINWSELSSLTKIRADTANHNLKTRRKDMLSLLTTEINFWK